MEEIEKEIDNLVEKIEANGEIRLNGNIYLTPDHLTLQRKIKEYCDLKNQLDTLKSIGYS